MKKKHQKKEKKIIIFDEKERTEYLTGFHKRKLARKLKAKEKLDAQLKEEKKKIKKKQKEALHEALINQRQVPEIEHLLKPVTIDLPEHTVTISEIEDFNSIPVTSSLHVTDVKAPESKDEIEKLRKVIKDLKSKRIKSLQKSSAQLNVKKRQRKLDKAKAKKMQRLLQKSAKHTKKKHQKEKKKF